jgi:hypothetical protein
MPVTPLLSTWNEGKQARWRQTHAEKVMVFHVLLDASGSMAGHEVDLRRAYNLYLDWLKQHADPMSLIETQSFGTHVRRSDVQALGTAPPLTAETYTARLGGTSLFDAIGTVTTTALEPMQHVLIVFTDGEDTSSEQYTAGAVAELLTTLQEHSGWLCVFLGAYPDALATARTLGFHDGNCVTFAGEQIPEAFLTLQRATQRYLTAAPADRKLLAAGTFFPGA